MDTCKICSGNFHDSPDSLIFCEHQDNFVHLGCCIDQCSMNKQPCQHAHSTYEKI